MIDYDPDLDIPAKLAEGPLVVRDMPAEVYHDLPFVSASILAEWHIDEAQGELALNKTKDEPTMDMLYGTAFHALCLEPDLFFATTIERKNIGPSAIKTMQEEQAKHPGKMVLARGWRRSLDKIQRKLAEHPAAHKALFAPEGKPAIKELCLFWTEIVHGARVLCKARLDYWHPKWEVCLDLKSTRDARRHKFEKIIADLSYHLRSGWYVRGLQRCGLSARPHFGWIPVEKKAPYRVSAFAADPRCISQGWSDAAAALFSLIGYLERGCVLTPPPPKFEEGVDLPVWARSEPDINRQFTQALEQPEAASPEKTWTLPRKKRSTLLSPTDQNSPNGNPPQATPGRRGTKKSSNGSSMTQRPARPSATSSATGDATTSPSRN